MVDTIEHEIEVKELFENLTVEIPGGNGLRAINLECFKMAANNMLIKGIYHGGQNVLKTTQDVIEKVFKEVR